MLYTLTSKNVKNEQSQFNSSIELKFNFFIRAGDEQLRPIEWLRFLKKFRLYVFLTFPFNSHSILQIEGISLTTEQKLYGQFDEKNMHIDQIVY